MTKHYISFSVGLLSFFNAAVINDVASSCQKKLKSARVNLSLVFVLLGAMTSSHQVTAHNISNSFFKSQNSHINYYLAYATYQGIGGGGGGHGDPFKRLTKGIDTFQVYLQDININTYNLI